MMSLPEKYLDPARLHRMLGELSPLAGIREFVYENGPAEGVHAAEVYNASGLRFIVLKSRAIDIADASFKGIPLAFQGAPGITVPTQAYYQEDDFLWGFYGGLLLTGGLTYVGEPTEDQGQKLGLHGRVNQLRGRIETVRQAWEGGNYILEIVGEVRESRVFGPNMRLRRRILTTLVSPTISIEDVVTNLADVPWPHAMLYHVSFGYPLIAPGADIVYEAEDYVEWSASVRDPSHPQFNKVQSPSSMHHGAKEDFTHILPKTDSDGVVKAGIFNPELQLGVIIQYPLRQMPRLGLWQHYGAGGDYAVAFEPMTGFVEGRARDRDADALIELQPGESKAYRLDYTVLEGFKTSAEFQATFGRDYDKV